VGVVMGLGMGVGMGMGMGMGMGVGVPVLSVEWYADTSCNGAAHPAGRGRADQHDPGSDHHLYKTRPLGYLSLGLDISPVRYLGPD